MQTLFVSQDTSTVSQTVIGFIVTSLDGKALGITGPL